jgi:hypothetical protein
MVFGIIVEGERDAAVYSILIRRVRPDVDDILSRSCGGIVGLRRQFVAWLKSFQWHSDPVVAKALVICDSDCRGSQSVQDELDRILNQSGFRPQLALPVHFYATRCEVENWLLTDESAVNKVARDRGKAGKAQAVADNLEVVRNAKERFLHMLSQADLPATAQVYAEVARAADLDLVAKRCPYFQWFVDIVRAC